MGVTVNGAVPGDDAMTINVVEPSDPFPLGLIVRNTGRGKARNLSIASAQPEPVTGRGPSMTCHGAFSQRRQDRKVGSRLIASAHERTEGAVQKGLLGVLGVFARVKSARRTIGDAHL